MIGIRVMRSRISLLVAGLAIGILFTGTGYGQAAKLAIISVNGGVDPVAGAPFSILVQAQDAGGNPAVTSSSTQFGIAIATGNGVISGTLTGTIAAGTDSIRVSGITYTKAESGVSLSATVISGDGLTAGTSPFFTVDPGPLADFLVENAGGGSIPGETAGTPFNIRITARDANGNTQTGFGGTVTISSTGTLSSGGGTTGTFNAGVLASTPVTISNTGNFTITATGGGQSGSSNSFAVGPGALANFLVENAGGGSIPGETAGTPFNIRITARDANGNTQTGFGGTVTISSTGTLSSGGGTTGTFNAGVLASTPVTISNTGNFTITATGGGQSGSSNSFVVGPGALANFLVEYVGGGLIPGETAGTPFNIRITARDAIGNTQTGFVGTVTISSTGTLSTGGGTSGAFTAGVLASTPITFSNTGNFTITATGGGQSGTSNSFAVGPGALANFLVEGAGGGSIPTETAGAAFNIKITARDANGNTQTGYTGTVSITSTGTLSAGGGTTANFVSGVLASTSVTISNTGTFTITAAGGGQSGTSNSFAVNSGGVTNFLVEAAAGGSIAPQTAGTAFSIKITARDAGNNVVTSFTGTVDLTSTGNLSSGSGTTPAFVNGVLASRSVTISNTGTFSIIATRTGGTETGASNAFLVGPGVLANFLVESSAGGSIGAQTAAAPFTIRITARDANNNTQTGFSGTVTISSTGALSAGGGTSTSFVAGVLTSTSVTISNTGNFTITATNTAGAQNGTSNAFTVGPGPLANFLVEAAGGGAIGTQTAGTAFAIKITARDANNNIQTGFVGTVTITSSGTLFSGGGTSAAFTAGVLSSSNVTISNTGSFTITATNSAGAQTGTSTAFTVNPGALANFLVENAGGGAIPGEGAGTPFSIKITARDANNNTVTGFVGTVTISSTGTLSAGGGTSGAFTAGVLASTSVTISNTGTFTITATNTAGVQTGTSNSFAVSAGGVSNFLVEASAGGAIGAQTAGTPFTIKITARDALNNTVTSFTGNVTITSTGTLSAGGGASASFVNGVLASTSVTVSNTGSFTITATNTAGAQSGTSNSFAVGPGALANFLVESSAGGAIGAQTAGTPFTIKITARDADNNTQTGFTGTVTISSTGTLSAGGGTSAAFVGGVLASTSVTISNSGTFTITATNTAGAQTGTSNSFAVGAGGVNNFLVEAAAGGTIPTETAGVAFNIKITARDVNNNTVTSFTGTATLTSAGGKLAGSPVVTPAFVAGVLASQAVTLDSSGTLKTITATRTGGTETGTSAGFTVNPAAGAKIVFSVQPSNTVAAATITPAVQVTIQDAFGNTASDNSNVVISMGTNPGGGTLSGTLTVAAVNGVASFSTLSINKSGTGYTLNATCNSFSVITSSAFNITAGTAFRLAFLQQPTAVAAGAVIAPAVSVQIQDNNGNLVTTDARSVTLALGSNPSGGVLGGTATVAASGGVATFSTLTVNKSGVDTLTASSSPALTTATSSPFSVTAGAATKIAVATQPSVSNTAGVAFATQPVIWVEDAAGNVVTTDTSTVTASSSSGAGILKGTLAVKAVNGVVQFGNLSQNLAATGITLGFSRSGFTAVNSSAINIAAAAAAQVFFVQEPPASATAGVALSPALTTQIKDAYGNNVSTASNVTLALVGTGTLSGTLTQAVNGTGLATFGDISINLAGSKKITANNSLGLTPDTSTAISIVPAVANKLAMQTEPSATATAGVAFVQQPVVQIQDAFGNLRSADTSPVTPARGKGTGTLSPVTAVNAVGGVATFAGLKYSGVDTTNVVFSATGLTSVTSTDIVSSPGALSNFIVEASAGGNIPAETAGTPFTIRITARDASNNTVTSFTGTVTIASTGTLSGGGGTSAAFTNGVLTTQVTVANTGSFTITATNTAGAQTGTSNAFAVSAGALANFLVEASGGGAIPAETAGTAFTIRITARDANNNTVTTFTGPDTIKSPAGGLVGSPVVSGAFVAGVLSSQSVTLTSAGALRTITATSGSLTSASNTFTLNPGAATEVRVETAVDGSGTVLGVQNISSGTSDTVYAIRRDANHNFIDNAAADTWTLQVLSGGVVPGDLVAINGKKSAVLTGRITGTAQINVTLGTLTPVNSGILTIVNAGAASKILVETAANGTGTVVPARNLASGTGLTVYAVTRDLNNNFVRNSVASWSVVSLNGNVVSSDLVPSGDGRSATLTGKLVGAAQIRADSASLVATLSGAITVIPGAPSTLTTAGGSPQSATVNSAFAASLAAAVKDAAGNSVPGATVTFSAPSSGASGTFTGGNTPVSDTVGGIARVGFKADSKSGTYVDTARVAGVAAPALFALTNNPTALFSITADTASQKQSTQIGHPFPLAFSVAVKDTFGNPISGAPVTFALVEGPSGSSGAFLSGGTTTQATTNTSGIATAESFVASLNAESYTVNASTPGLAKTAVFTLTNTAGAVSGVTIVSGSPQSKTVKTAFDTLVVKVVDIVQNGIPNLLVRFVAPASGATGKFGGLRTVDSILTNAQGIARSSVLLADSVAGTFTVNAFASGITTPAVFSLTAAAGPVANFLFEAQAGGPIGTQLVQTPFPVKITARDQYGNAATSFTDSVDITSTGTLTAGGGRAGGFVAGILPSYTLQFQTPGSFTVTAKRKGGLETGTSNVFAVDNPLPTFSSISPNFGKRGSIIPVVISGSGFIRGVTTLNFGAGVSVVPGSDTVASLATLFAKISIDTNAAEGPRTFVITNFPPGGGSAFATNAFTIGSNPAAKITSIAPASAARLQTLSLVIKGNNFADGVTTVDLGPGILYNNLRIDSLTGITVNITVTPTALTGPRNVIVKNALPGGGADTLKGGLTMTNPAPTLTAIAPASAFKGQTLDVIFTGTNFISATTAVNIDTNAAIVNSIGVSGDDLTLDANITVKSTAVAGPYNVTVSNPAPGGGTSSAQVFTVNSPPVPPTLIAPLNGLINLFTRQQLRWSKPLGSTKYRVQLSISPVFNGVSVDDSTLTDTTRLVTGLLNDTAYYWRVSAKFPLGWSLFSAADTFSTGASYPAKFALTDTIYFPTKVNAGDFLSTDYQIVGLPGMGNKPLATVLGGTFNKDWTASWDNGAATGYMITYDGSATFQFSAGRAFWILRRGSLIIKDSVASVPIDTTGTVKIPLHAGWNLITNPFPVSVAWSYVQTLNGGIKDSIWKYNAGPSVSATFAPYAGYYLFNTNALDSLKVPFSGLGTVSPPPSLGKTVAGGWRVGVSVASDLSVDQGVTLGVAPGATSGLSAANYRKPRMLSAIPLAFFNRPEWDPKYATFGADIRPGVTTLEKWAFEVDYTGRKPFELRFAGVENVPPEMHVFLVDESRARSADLRFTGSYAFTPSTDVSKFTVLVGTPDAVSKELASVLPTEFALGANYPNPFNPSTTIPVAVPTASRIALRVYNILGQEIRTVFEGAVEGGRYAFTWDGRSGAGNPVATGVYIVRLTTDTGKHFTAKMLLLK